MKVKVYMPYFSYTNDDFDVENAYKSESDYVKAMEEAYNSTKDIITETMSGSYSGNFTGTDGNTYKFGAKEAKKDKISFTGCECVIYNEAGKPDSVDGLIDHFAKGDDFLETIVADLDGAPEEFLTQWGSWIGEHKRVNRAGEEGRKNKAYNQRHPERKRMQSCPYIQEHGQEGFYQHSWPRASYPGRSMPPHCIL